MQTFNAMVQDHLGQVRKVSVVAKDMRSAVDLICSVCRLCGARFLKTCD